MVRPRGPAQGFGRAGAPAGGGRASGGSGARQSGRGGSSDGGGRAGARQSGRGGASDGRGQAGAPLSDVLPSLPPARRRGLSRMSTVLAHSAPPRRRRGPGRASFSPDASMPFDRSCPASPTFVENDFLRAVASDHSPPLASGRSTVVSALDLSMEEVAHCLYGSSLATRRRHPDDLSPDTVSGSVVSSRPTQRRRRELRALSSAYESDYIMSISPPHPLSTSPSWFSSSSLLRTSPALFDHPITIDTSIEDDARRREIRLGKRPVQDEPSVHAAYGSSELPSAMLASLGSGSSYQMPYVDSSGDKLPATWPTFLTEFFW